MADNGGWLPKGPADEGKMEWDEAERDNQVAVVPFISFLGTELKLGWAWGVGNFSMRLNYEMQLISTNEFNLFYMSPNTCSAWVVRVANKVA